MENMVLTVFSILKMTYCLYASSPIYIKLANSKCFHIQRCLGTKRWSTFLGFTNYIPARKAFSRCFG